MIENILTVIAALVVIVAGCVVFMPPLFAILFSVSIPGIDLVNRWIDYWAEKEREWR